MAKDKLGKKLERKPWKNRHRTLENKVLEEFHAFNRFGGTMPDTQAGRFKNGIKVVQGFLSKVEHEIAADGIIRSVRAVGAAWSLSRVLVTDGYVINTKPLNLIVTDLRHTDFEPKHNPEKFVLTQCGASVKEINKQVEAKELGLFTTGASDGQTIAGAISTGTHGSAINYGSMPDYVMGMHLITSSSEHYWLEGNERVVSDAFLDEFMPGVVRRNDDELFHAAIVSFGSFGVVHGYLLACDDIYKLNVYVKSYPRDQAIRCVYGPADIEAELGLPPNPHHFEIDLNPFKNEQVVVQAMYKEYGKADEVNKPSVRTRRASGIDPIQLIGSIDNALGNHAKWLMKRKFLNNLLKKQFSERCCVTKAPRFEFGGSEDDLIQPAMSTELGFNQEDALFALLKILSVAQSHPFIGMVAMRYIKQSKATLSFARFPTTVAFELPAVRSRHTWKFYKALWEQLDKNNFDFSFHWGQMNNIDITNIERRWRPEQVLAWKSARETLLSTKVQRGMFSNKFLKECGLAG